jgi:GDP-mannose 6-dehydrogenase
MGHEVTGVDVDPFKVDLINKGHSPIVEELIDDLIRAARQTGRLQAIEDPAACIAGSEMSLVCVGTPSMAGGALETSYVRRVAAQIGEALASKPDYHVVVIRSTVLPGTVEDVVAPILVASSGKRLGPDFGLCFHPEFLREGSSVKDFREPPKIVIGAGDPRSADTLASLYEGFEAPLFKTSIRAAEMVKYADNAFHALKVVFGNEVGAVCKALQIDSHEVMNIFCRDRKLNISANYLMPGFAYGGSCLPKDLRALMHLARSQNVDLPVLSNVDKSNQAQIARALHEVLSLGKRKIGLLGLSFKPGTDDLRESPLVELTERLLGKGCRIRIYDESVSLARLRGGNKAYIEQRLPHISNLLVQELEEVVRQAEVIIVGTANPKFAEVLAAHGREKAVVDLVRLFGDKVPRLGTYRGICW